MLSANNVVNDFTNYTSVGGSFVFQYDTFPAIVLPISVINGVFAIGSSVTPLVNLPILSVVTSDLSIVDNTFTSLSMPLLSYVGYYFVIQRNNALLLLSLPSLNMVGFSQCVGTSGCTFGINLNSALTSISLPALSSAGLSVGMQPSICGNAPSLVISPSLQAIGNGHTSTITSSTSCP